MPCIVPGARNIETEKRKMRGCGGRVPGERERKREGLIVGSVTMKKQGHLGGSGG